MLQKRHYDLRLQIVSNTSMTEAEVKVYQDIAKKTGAEFISIIAENRHNGVSVQTLQSMYWMLKNKGFQLFFKKVIHNRG